MEVVYHIQQMLITIQQVSKGTLSFAQKRKTAHIIDVYSTRQNTAFKYEVSGIARLMGWSTP
jgi:hypothetical protein